MFPGLGHQTERRIYGIDQVRILCLDTSEERKCISLTRYITNNKEADNDWFRLESNKEGTRWFGKCWHYHNQVLLLSGNLVETNLSAAKVRIWCGVRHTGDLPDDKPRDCLARVGREDSKGEKGFSTLLTSRLKHISPSLLRCTEGGRFVSQTTSSLCGAEMLPNLVSLWELNIFLLLLQVLLMQWPLAWDPGWLLRYQTW